ncbi:hypothetical protein ABIF67_008148 [Bradyrhizobium japonicum]
MHGEHGAAIALQDRLRRRVAAHCSIERAFQHPRPHRRFAAVVNRLDGKTVLLVELVDRHVRGRARAIGAEVDLAALAREGDEILQRLDPGLGVRDQQQAGARNDADQRQILVHVVAGILHHDPVHDVGGRDRAQDGVAVGLGAGDLCGADRAGGAGLVLDHDGLADLLGDEFAIGAREQIGLSAGGIAANHADLPRGPTALRCALRRGAARDEGHRECAGTSGNEVAAIEFCGHDSLLIFADPTASGWGGRRDRLAHSTRPRGAHFSRHPGDRVFRMTRSQTISVRATAIRPNVPPISTLTMRSSAMPLAPPAKDAASAMKKQRRPKPTT